MKSFYQQNELTYYSESLDEIAEKALELPARSVIIYNGKKEDGTSDFRVFMVTEDHTANEL